jgi:serralysin
MQAVNGAVRVDFEESAGSLELSPAVPPLSQPAIVAKAAGRPLSAPEPISASVVANVESGDEYVDALLYLSRWDLSSITYSFPDAASDYEDPYSDDDEPSSGFGELTSEYKDAHRYVLEGGADHYGSYESFLELAISEVSDAGGIIRSAFSSVPSTAKAYYPSSNARGGDAWFNETYMTARPDPDVGNYVYLTTLHELGHALGLKHGHTGDNGLTGLPIPADRDSLEFSVMTYRSYEGASTSGGYTNESFGFPQTPMMLDIAALQHMYGADFGLNDDDTT